jgi:hypothetical protein
VDSHFAEYSLVAQTQPVAQGPQVQAAAAGAGANGQVNGVVNNPIMNQSGSPFNAGEFRFYRILCRI